MTTIGTLSMLKVFLSSTFKNLKRERKAVESVIHRMAVHFIGMEHFGSFYQDPAERCKSKVRSADVFVLILGGSYGHVPKDSKISMTEMEYKEATINNIQILCYLSESIKDCMRHRWISSKLFNLQAEITSKHGVSWFSSPDDLAWKVASDITRECANRLSKDAMSANDLMIATLADQVEKLIDILEFRANIIQKQLEQYFQYSPVAQYISQFTELHQRHVMALRRGDLILAHEMLMEIHKLSYKLTQNELFKTHEGLNIAYVSPNTCQLGILICMYVAGDMTHASKKYPSREANRMIMRKPSPVTSLDLYEIILSTST